MDWELLSQQTMRHVEEQLPSGSILSRDREEGERTGVDPPGSSLPDSILEPWVAGGTRGADKERIRSFDVGSDSRDVESWGAERLTLCLNEQGGYISNSSGMQRLDAIVDSLQEQQAVVDHTLRLQRHNLGRGLAEVWAALRRLEVEESRISGQVEDLGSLKIICCRAEGKMTVLQGRQDQLEVKACDVSDNLTALERRCMLVEATSHGTVTHGKVIDLILSVFQPFREKVDERLSNLETEELDNQRTSAQTASRGFAEEVGHLAERAVTVEVERVYEIIDKLKSSVEGRLVTEARRQDVEGAILKQKVDDIAHHIRVNDARAKGQEAEIRSISATVDAVEKRLASAGAQEASRIRRELIDADNGANRQIEEVRAAGIRKAEEISSELGREREARQEENREIHKGVSNVHAAVQQTDRRLDGTHERLDRLEASVAHISEEQSKTNISTTSIGSTVKELQLEVQALNASIGRITKDSVTSKAVQKGNPLGSSATPLPVVQIPTPTAEVSTQTARQMSLLACTQARTTPETDAGGNYHFRTASGPPVEEPKPLIKVQAKFSSVNGSLPIPEFEDEPPPRGFDYPAHAYGPRTCKEEGIYHCDREIDEKPVRGSRNAFNRPQAGERYESGNDVKCNDGEYLAPSLPSNPPRVDINVPQTGVSPDKQAPVVAPSSSRISAGEESLDASVGERVGYLEQTGRVEREGQSSLATCLTPSSLSPHPPKIVDVEASRSKHASDPTGPRVVADSTRGTGFAVSAGDTPTNGGGNKVVKSAAQGIYVSGSTKTIHSSPPQYDVPLDEREATKIFLEENISERKPPSTSAQGSPSQAAGNARTLTQSPPLSLTTRHVVEGRKKSVQDGPSGPTPISLRERSGCRDSGMATAQCEFCLRRYLQIAMNNHLEACELRMIRCPYQCGVRTLVRNLEKHKEGCSLRHSARARQDIEPDFPVPRSPVCPANFTVEGTPTVVASSATPPSEALSKSSMGKDGRAGGTEDNERRVTCMRCHENLPFYLVPSHGPQCKGGGGLTPVGAPPPTGPRAQSRSPLVTECSPGRSPPTSTPPSSVRVRAGVGRRNEALLSSREATSRSPGLFSPDMGIPEAWDTVAGIDGVLRQGIGITKALPRASKDVRSWSIGQVTSWLRETMRPPRADIIARFIEARINGAALLDLTDRDLLHPTEGMGIIDADIRRGILKALDALAN